MIAAPKLVVSMRPISLGRDQNTDWLRHNSGVWVFVLHWPPRRTGRRSRPVRASSLGAVTAGGFVARVPKTVHAHLATRARVLAIQV